MTATEDTFNRELVKNSKPAIFWLLAWALLFMLCVDRTASAQVYTDQTAFLAALTGGSTTYDFDQFTQSTLMTNQLPGVNFGGTATIYDEQHFPSGGAFHSPPNVLLNFPPPNPIVISFNPPVDGVGFFNTSISDREQVTIFDTLGVPIFVGQLPEGSVNFFGYVSATKIGSISVVGIPPQTFGTIFIDDLSFGNVATDTTAPTVVGVHFDGTSWDSAFRTAAGNGAYGYPAQTAAGQLTTMPWSTLNTIYVKFSEDVVVTSAALGVRGINQANYAISNFSYDNVNFVAKWVLSGPINTDRLIFDLDGSTALAVKDLAGNKLAGNWIEGVSSFPTTGSAGTNFKYRFVVAVGDADRNGQVRNADVNAVRANLFVDAGQAGFNIFADIDGNGLTRNVDINAVRGHLFIDPPSGPGPN